eukprot:COSAG06_NODE_1748_length_8478_cov_16.692923_11_plen_52_part_00
MTTRPIAASSKIGRTTMTSSLGQVLAVRELHANVMARTFNGHWCGVYVHAL